MAEKVKKSLHPAIACALMVIMLCCALLNGAHKAWTKEQNALEQYRAAVLESVQARVETAIYAAVQSDLRSMENGKTTFSVVSVQQFHDDAQALLQSLAQRQDVQADGRDNMYVTQMLPQAVDMCLSSDSAVAYNEAAASYNERMHSFSGLLARWTGVSYAALFNDGVQSATN